MSISTTAMLRHLRAAVAEAGGVRAYARKTGVSAAHVSDVLAESREPGPKILGPIGLTKHVSRVVGYEYIDGEG